MTTISDLIRSASIQKPDVVPEGWQTAVQIGTENNLGGSRTRQLVFKLAQEGKLEMKKFRIPFSSGVRPVQHYRAVQDMKHAQRKTQQS